MKKYELLNDDVIDLDGKILHRIRKISDHQLGGYIEKESNLSQKGDCWIFHDACVFGNAYVFGDACVSGDACIKRVGDYIAIGPIGSRNDFTTFYKTGKNVIYVSCGCFNDSINEFYSRVTTVHFGSKFYTEYMAVIDMAKKIFSL